MDQTYVDAINRTGLFWRRDSLLSAGSNEGISPLIMSPSHGSIQWHSQDFTKGGIQRRYAPPNAVNAALISPVAGNLTTKLEHLVISGDHVDAAEGNLRPNQGKVEAFIEESLYRSDQSSNNGTVSSGKGNGNGGNRDFSHQPLSQLPSLHPTHFQQLQRRGNKGFSHLPLSQLPPLHPTHFQQPQSVYIPQSALRLDDCQMYQRALPHSHSDTLINNNHANGNGNGYGSSAIHEVRPVLQSYHYEDLTRLQASLGPESVALEPKVETAAVAPGQFSRQHENERAVHLNVEALDHAKVLHPNGVMGVADLSRLQALPRVVNGVVADSETKVEKLPTGGQFAANGFTEEIVHPHDKERRHRLKRKTKWRLIWGCVGLSVTIGASLLVYSYLPNSGKHSLPTFSRLRCMSASYPQK
jgi:hypothetical protein